MPWCGAHMPWVRLLESSALGRLTRPPAKSGVFGWDASTSFVWSAPLLRPLQARFADLAPHEGEAERILRQGGDKARVIAVTLPSGPRGPHVDLAVGAWRRNHWSMGFVTDTDTNGGKAHLMWKLLTLSLALALTALLTVTGFVVYGGDGGTAARQGKTSSDPPTGSRQETRSRSAEPAAVGWSNRWRPRGIR